MGSKLSCCKANTPRVQRKNNVESTGVLDSDVLILRQDESTCNLQHISEREPEDFEADPSTHPTAGPLFMQRSRSDIRSQFNQ